MKGAKLDVICSPVTKNLGDTFTIETIITNMGITDLTLNGIVIVTGPTGGHWKAEYFTANLGFQPLNRIVTVTLPVAKQLDMEGGYDITVTIYDAKAVPPVLLDEQTCTNAVSVGVIPPPPTQCSDHTTQSACVAAGCYWWSDNTCQSSPEPVTAPRISGYVTDSVTGQPINISIITFGSATVYSDVNGYYEILNPDPISGNIICSKSGYLDSSIWIQSPMQGTLNRDFVLIPGTPTPTDVNVTLQFPGTVSQLEVTIHGDVNQNKYLGTADKAVFTIPYGSFVSYFDYWHTTSGGFKSRTVDRNIYNDTLINA